VSVRLTSQEGTVALFDSTRDWAFGPVFKSTDQAEDFLRYLARHGYHDARDIAPNDLIELHNEWIEPRL